MAENFSVEELIMPVPIREFPSYRLWKRNKQKQKRRYTKYKQKKRKKTHIDIYA